MNEQHSSAPQQTPLQTAQQGSQSLVMDVQPPAASQPAASQAVIPAAQPTSVPRPEQVTASPIATAPSQESKQSGDNLADVEPVSIDKQNESALPLLEAKATSASSRFRPAVAVAVVVGLVLCGVAVYAYLQSNKQSTASLGSQQASKAPQPTEENAAIEDIEAAQSEVEEAIGTDIDSDFTESELTDEALGL